MPTIAIALLLHAMSVPAESCAALPYNRTTPFVVNGIIVDSLPASSTEANGALKFENRMLRIVPPAAAMALDIRFEVGSVGPVEVAQRNGSGSVIGTINVVTNSQPAGTVTVMVPVAKVYDLLLKSQNNEGAILAVCIAVPEHRD